MKLINRISLVAVVGLVATALLITLAPSSRADDTNSVASASSKPVPYPLDYCVVSGDKLNSMGDPVVFVYSNGVVNQEIKFCCDSCKPTFLKDPDKYMKVIQDAEAKQKKKDAKN